jgi:hypothetical protein
MITCQPFLKNTPRLVRPAAARLGDAMGRDYRGSVGCNPAQSHVQEGNCRRGWNELDTATRVSRRENERRRGCERRRNRIRDAGAA